MKKIMQRTKWYINLWYFEIFGGGGGGISSNTTEREMLFYRSPSHALV